MKRWSFRIFLGLLILALLLVAAVGAIVETGTAERWARTAIVQQLEKSTGARVELSAFHFQLRTLRFELDDLTLHGSESPGLPPLFHADRILVGVHIISLLDRKASLSDLEIDEPSVFVRVGENGRSNIPTPPVKRTSRPWREQLFNLQIAEFKIGNGSLLYNDAKIPLAAEGKDFQFSMNYEAPAAGKEAYVGQLAWKQMEFAARRYLPFASDISARFTLTKDSVSLDELQWRSGNTKFEAHGEVRSFQPLDVDFHFIGHVSLPDLRQILRKPEMPDGQVDFTGNGGYAQKQLRMEGHYLARGLYLKFQWFHERAIDSWGDIHVAKDHLTLPNFEVRALGGGIKGNMDLNFHGLAFRVNAVASGDSLAEILDAVDNPNLPVHTFHWDGSVTVNSVCTWTRDFKHFTASGVTNWTPPQKLAPGTLPVTAQIPFDYSMDRRSVLLKSSTIFTPDTNLEFSGSLGAEDSDLHVNFHTARVADWDEFISVLRGPGEESEKITGKADWKGTVTGPLHGPTFAGEFRVRDAHYSRLYWDDITGDMSYSPDVFKLMNAVVKRGHSEAKLNLQLDLDGSWGFAEDDTWSLDAHLDHAASDDLQGLFATNYPASAVVTADFHGSGTHHAPQLDGKFQLQNVIAYGVRFDGAQGQLSLAHDQIHITEAELDRDSGHITGNLLYRPAEKTIEFQLAGTALPIDKFRFLQSKALPISGQLGFLISGSGPLLAPEAHGSLQLVNLQFGGEVLDSFEGQLDSDGKVAQLDLRSTKTPGKLGGHFELALSDKYPLTGKMTVKQIDLDPFIIAGLHLSELTGHSSIDGVLDVSGELRNPDSLEVQANLSRVVFNYEYVKLQNEGPVRLSYRRSEVRVEQASLSGSDTNFHFSGDARFAGSRALNLNVAGVINLRLVSGLFPDLDARGSAQVNGSVTGTFSNPQITGQAKIVDVSAHYGDFPAGISKLNGTVVFDRSRLSFENMKAEAGGGNLTISGSMEYGEGPLRYEVDTTASKVRVRFPEGLSWLLDGQAKFSGTSNGALLSGRVTVQRLIFAENVDFASLLVASQTNLTGPAITSAYLRNLQFDINADAAPGARIEWAGAHFTTEGSVRVRGTWEHPIVLGNIHLLAGQMDFHGNTFRLTRGDINFSNPFRFDPVLNVEASTTINPYEITLDFSGAASRMQLAYRSDPPLPASDIIALLALGTPGESTAQMSSTSSGTQNFGATALLSEAISSQLGGPIQRLFGISHFRVDPFLANTLSGTGTQSAAARVTIQQQVTRELSVTYSTNANSNQEQVIEVDYNIRRDITIVGLRDINGIFGVNIKFTNHFR